MTREVLVHVGPAKSGTTYLQKMLFLNRELLRRNGVIYPGSRASQFLPVLDLKGVAFKGHRYPEAEGAWDRLTGEVRDFDGDLGVISHETIARSSARVMHDVVSSFPGSKVSVLITCRDLGRQIPASWQENVKNRNPTPFADFLEQIFDTWERGDERGTYWYAQDLGRLARRWGALVGSENVRLVTVPPPGSSSTLLWERFAEAAGFPELDYDFDVTGDNPSLGAVGAELLRRLNAVLPEDLGWRDYERRIKGAFVRVLREHPTGDKLTVPEEWRERTGRLADRMIADLRDGGYPLVGDLEDLRPSYLSVTTLPDQVGDDQLLELALQAILDQALRKPRASRPAPAPRVGGRQAVRILVRSLRRRLP